VDPVALDVREASADEAPVVRRLMQLYLYDLGSGLGWDLDDQGVFGRAVPMERYWSEAGCHPFLVRVGGKLAGFALVRRGSELADTRTHEIAEFFILRKYRHQGIGERVARGLFDPLPWSVVGAGAGRQCRSPAVRRLRHDPDVRA
jgi:predicted acetyltransferase